MSSNGIKQSDQEDEVVLRDLQTLLRKSIGDEVEVVDFTTSLLLPKGENYASTMLKVDARIKKTRSSPVENLPLVAKMIPTGEYQKIHFNSGVSCTKEIFVFEKLVPKYRRLEEEAGLRGKELIDILPKYYGGRLTRNGETAEADNDMVMLMENLKVRGYSTKNRMQGLDFVHAKLAISELARFHALGIALRQKDPQEFARVQSLFDVSFVKIQSDAGDIIKCMYDRLCTDSRIAAYKDRIWKALDASKGWESLLNVELVEPWISIIHGDFWVNNVMFHEENGKVVDVKFVDFQLSRANSPLKDLPYFLCGSVSSDTVDNHFDDLLDAYHGRLLEALGKLGCDTSPFSKDAFEKQLKIDGSNELFHCLMAIKFFTLEVNDKQSEDIQETLMRTDGSSLYFDRSWKIVAKFVERGWI